MHPYAPAEIVLRHLSEQAERERRNPHLARWAKQDVRARSWNRTHR